MFADQVSMLRIFGSTGNPSVATTTTTTSTTFGRRIHPPKTMDANRQYHFNSGRASEPPMGVSSSPTHSPNIPLPSSHVHRTQSEIQLSIDEAAAEQREHHMFYRLVNGIRQRHYNQSELPNRGLARPHPSTRLQVPDFSDHVVNSEDLHESSDDVPALQDHKQPESNWPLKTLEPEGIMAISSLDAGGWSISGFDEPEQTTSRPELAWTSSVSPRQETEDENEEEELFALDL